MAEFNCDITDQLVLEQVLAAVDGNESRMQEDLFGPLPPEPRHCLICFDRIENNVTDPDQHVQAILNLLCKILKVSTTVYGCSNVDSLVGPLYCVSCGQTIQEALQVLREISRLETVLEIIRNNIKSIVLNTYATQRSDGHDELSPSQQAVCQIRKTFAQCWSNCIVRLKRSRRAAEMKEAAVKKQSLKDASKSVVYQRRKLRGRKPKKIEKIEASDAEDPVHAADNTVIVIEPFGDHTESVSQPMPDVSIAAGETEQSAQAIINHENSASQADIIKMDRDDYIDEPAVETLQEEDDPDYVPESPESAEHLGNVEDGENKEEKPEKKRGPKKSPWSSLPGVMRITKSQQYGQKFPFNCELCGKGYQQKHFLDVHMESHSGSWTHICFICQKKFPCARHLKLHEVNAHQLPTTNSRRITQAFQGQGVKKTRKHRLIHGFTCPHCQKEYIRKDYVTDQGTVHVKCDIPNCTKEFFIFAHFRVHHEKSCPQKPEVLFMCETCGKGYSSEKTLREHTVISHTKAYPFCCELCGTGMVSQGALTRHMLAHTDEKKHECEVCHKKFKRKMQLTYHMRHHNREALLMCGVCGKTCTNPQSLRSHELTHSDEKRFPCDICGKKFKTVNYVYNHKWSTHKKARTRRDRPPKSEESLQE